MTDGRWLEWKLVSYNLRNAAAAVRSPLHVFAGRDQYLRTGTAIRRINNFEQRLAYSIALE